MRQLFFCLLILALGCQKLFGQAANDPLEALLRQSQEKSSKLLAEMEKKAEVKVQIFLAAIKHREDVLLAEGDSENANIIQRLILKITGLPSSSEKVEAIFGELPPLATGIHKHVVEIEDEILAINKEYAPKVDKTSEPVIKYLRTQLQRIRGRNNLDGNRLQKLYEDYLAVPSPKFDDSIPTLPQNQDEARILWEKTHKELKIALDRDIRRDTNALFVALFELRVTALANKEQEVVERLDEIDLAFRVQITPQDLIQQTNSQRKRDESKLIGNVRWDAPLGWLEINAKRIPDPIEKIIREHSEKCDRRTSRYKKVTAELDKRWATFHGNELKELLLSDAPFETQLREVKKQFRLSRESPAWLLRGVTIPLPDSTPEVKKILAVFDAWSAQQLLEANKEEGDLRRTLIDELTQLTDRNDQEEKARSFVLKELTSDYAEGIRGTMLFEGNPQLSKEAQQSLVSYLKKTELIREELAQEHSDKLTECTAKLKPKRVAMVKRGDFEGALLVDVHLHRRRYPIPPIWIRKNIYGLSAGPHPYSWSIDMLLFAKGRDGFLVSSDDYSERWVSRTEVLLSWNDVSETEQRVGESVLGPIGRSTSETKPASVAVESDTKLKVGDEVLVFRGLAWEPHRIVDLSPFGVVCHIAPLGTTPMANVIPKTALRMTEGGSN